MNGHELEGRQMQRKRASFPGDAINGDMAAMGMGDVLDNGKAESRASEFPASGFIDPVESFEQAGQMLLHNSDSVVPDVNDCSGSGDGRG